MSENEEMKPLRKISDEELKAVLAEHKRWFATKGKKGTQADFSNSDIQNIDLQGANLEKANLWGANLWKANLESANLQGAELSDANLSQATLKWGKLSGAILQMAKLSGANLQMAKLNGADLILADIHDADLLHADLQGATLYRSNLKRAILFETNLYRTRLSKANLYRANLVGANLVEANLVGANLEGANLNSAKFTTREEIEQFDREQAKKENDNARKDNEGAEEITRPQFPDFLHAKLNGATLINCNLKYARNLYAGQLAGTDLTGSTLPEHITWEPGLEYVKESAISTNKTYYVLLGGCAYSALAIATKAKHSTTSTTQQSDKPLTLPVINSPVEMADFFVFAPAVIFLIHLYFLIKLQNVWRGLSKLPAYFEDGRPLYDRAYPWIFISLARPLIPLLRKKGDHPLDLWLQIFAAVVMAWVVVPVTLYYFWREYVLNFPSLDANYQIGIFGINVFVSVLFGYLAVATLSGYSLWERIKVKAISLKDRLAHR
ncbi:MAG: pentapeptide repeat-containing protein [Nitrospirae bacterium]|nr:pentapeptide repeat-containing protein [Nitrospirota bacterium]